MFLLLFVETDRRRGDTGIIRGYRKIDELIFNLVRY